MANDSIQPLTIKSLLSKSEYKIPIYQRNYDWGENETLQLIEDIADYATLKKGSKHYYIGSVIVFLRTKGSEEYYETIDGQQRLTTLTIIMNVLCSMDELKTEMEWFKMANLSYDHRNEADEALKMLAEGKFSDNPAVSSITEVYRIIRKNLKNILEKKDVELHIFVEYLLNNVIIMRIPLPRDTQLKHYFEIMNSRGEQLEMHEVLKASLMDNLERDKNTMCLFNDIWEACSDMGTYVQMKMKPKMRNLLFSTSWTNLQFRDFDELLVCYKDLNYNTDDVIEDDEYISRTLSELFIESKKNVKYDLPDIEKEAEGANDRFGSIINFQNFLLQTLKVMYYTDNEYSENIHKEINLDDKHLIDIFQKVLASCKNKQTFIKRFVMSLLHMRMLFDEYVIKRESYNNKETWSLKNLKKYDKSKVNYVGTFSGAENEDEIGKDIRMLEAMFHVSAPTQTYKYWLNAVLYYVHKYNEKTIDPVDMCKKLYMLACTYMLDRYLCDKKTDFEDIIYKNDFKAINDIINWKIIDKGCNVENFVFNFYDYIIWKSDSSKYFKFEFTYRTSVEHFYPQSPLAGYDVLDEKTGLNDFGNLCLISRGMNSKFSNSMPTAKYENFGNEAILNGLSLKLNEMMEIVKDKGVWSTLEITDFENKARLKLFEGIKEGCHKNIQ